MTEQAILAAFNAGQFKSIEDLFAKCDFINETYPNLMAAVCPQLCTRTEYKDKLKKAQREAQIRHHLGVVPANPRELVETVATNANLILDETNHLAPISWTDPLTQRVQKLNEKRFIEACKDVNRNVMASLFGRIDVTDQCGYFIDTLNETLRQRICEKLSPKPVASFDWQTFVTTLFDQSTQSADMQAAVLQKWIWMVKRRLNGLPVTHHICPVIFGSQGCGKTLTVEKMYAPLGALATRADFSRLADARDAGIFESFVVFFDEMSKADRAEMAAVKDAITRDTLSYRPMGSNINAKMDQNASFIGTSNKLLSQLINDPTGNRRFVELHFNSKARQREWDYCNTVDFTAMWQSVDHTAADPSLPFFEAIRGEQVENKTLSTVEQFVQFLISNKGSFAVDNIHGDFTLAAFKPRVQRWEYVYGCYRTHAKAMNMQHAVELQGFRNEMLRLIKEYDTNFVFQRKRAAGGAFNGLEYTGPRSLAVTAAAAQANPQTTFSFAGE